jgi:hypothetical protein
MASIGKMDTTTTEEGEEEAFRKAKRNRGRKAGK